MPISAVVTLSQGSDKTKFTATDATAYSSPETRSVFTNRVLTIYKADGTVYRQPGQTADEIDFNYDDYPDDEIEITLDKDYALTVIMTLTPPSVVVGSVYTDSAQKSFPKFTFNYFYERMKKIQVQPRLERNTAYVADTFLIIMYHDLAVQSGLDNDVESAQLALDRARNIELYNPKPY